MESDYSTTYSSQNIHVYLYFLTLVLLKMQLAYIHITFSSLNIVSITHANSKDGVIAPLSMNRYELQLHSLIC